MALATHGRHVLAVLQSGRAVVHVHRLIVGRQAMLDRRRAGFAVADEDELVACAR